MPRRNTNIAAQGISIKISQRARNKVQKATLPRQPAETTPPSAEAATPAEVKADQAAEATALTAATIQSAKKLTEKQVVAKLSALADEVDGCLAELRRLRSGRRSLPRRRVLQERIEALGIEMQGLI